MEGLVEIEGVAGLKSEREMMKKRETQRRK
jgi:hypothetical protein